MGMMPGTIGDINPYPGAAFHEAKIGIGIVEILGNGAVCAGIHFSLEIFKVLASALRLGVEFRIACHINMEVLAGLPADQLNQFACKAE